MRRKLLSIVCLAVASGLVAACTAPPKPLALSRSFWQEQTQKIGVALVESPTAGVHMAGPQDPLDEAIADAADVRLRQYLASVRPAEFGGLAEAFAARMRKAGLDVTVIPQPVERRLYGGLRTKDSEVVVGGNPDGLKARFGVDRLLLLSIDRFGVYRDYFVFVPTAAPLAMFQVRGKLVDLDGRKLLWRVSMVEKQNLVPIEGAWDQPPDYPGLTKALRRAEHDAVVYLENSFFPEPK